MRFGIIVLLLFILGACASTDTIAVHPEMISIKADSIPNNELSAIIGPYRDSLKGEMDRVVGYAPLHMMAARPSSSLMNWVADAVFTDQTRAVRLSTPTFCLLNNGEPIANARVEKGKLMVNGMRDGVTHFWVITSDYLMNGGDKATFFNKRTEVNRTGRLVRDALMSEIERVGTISADTTLRITF
ncbi:MAG: hypothetical protein LW704_08855 [Cryomorphaceae bacterium]|nr:hypothetical protein [Cryomorphaceae bacterium]